MATTPGTAAMPGDALRQAVASADAAAFNAPFSFSYDSVGTGIVPVPSGGPAILTIHDQGSAAVTVPDGYTAIRNASDKQPVIITGVTPAFYEGQAAGQSVLISGVAGGAVALTGGGNTVIDNSAGSYMIAAGLRDSNTADSATYALSAATLAGGNHIALGVGAATVATPSS